MKESNTGSHALPTNSASSKGKTSSNDYLNLSNEQNGQKKVPPLLPVTAAEDNKIESNKSIQHFEAIRDSHKSMVRLVDTMFDYLQAYADEENKANDDPNLSLHWQRPILEKQKNSESWLKNISDSPQFTGKLYTCNWSLIVKGTSELVTGYVIPSDRVISFNSEPESYSPYLTINYVKKGSNCGWQIDKEIITHEHIDDLAKKLLEKLLKNARSQEWSQSVFCLQSIGMGLALQDKELKISKNLAKTADDPEQFLIDLMKAASQQAKLPLDEFVIAEPVPLKNETEEISSRVKTEPVSSQLTFEITLKALPNLLDQKLKQLSKEGGEAFSNHDLKGAQDMLTLSNELSEFKNKVKEIITAFKIQH